MVQRLEQTVLSKIYFFRLPAHHDLLTFWPIFNTGVPNLRPYQLATGKMGDPLAAGKPFINNFLPNGGDMLRLNMATPVTQRDDENFSSLGLIAAAVAGLTNPDYASTDLEFIPNMDGFPNGRRLEDDVTRIELQAVAGVVLSAIGLWEDDYNPEEDDSPVTEQLGAELGYSTGVEENDVPFRSTFPYVQLPFSGTSECSGLAIEYVQPEILDPTVIDEGCQEFVYFLSDFTPGMGTDIYAVTLSESDAEMELIANTSEEVAIAYNGMNNLIYAVSKTNNFYWTLNPYADSPVFSASISLGGSYGQITGATFAANGDLLISDQVGDVIYAVNVNTNVVTVYDATTPILGGDLTSISTGNVYLSTNKGAGLLYEVFTDMASEWLANIPSSTGIAATASDQLLVSSRNSMSLNVYDTDGSSVESYNLLLDGEAFTLNFGDLASGCNTYVAPEEGGCDNLVTYYAQFNPESNVTDIYLVDFSDGSANLVFVSSLGGNISIAYDGANNIIYGVPKVFTSANGITNTSVTAAVFNPADGLVYFGDDITNSIYTLDVNTNVAEFYAEGLVRGGDLALTEAGSVYLATQTENSLYEVNTMGSSDFVGTIASNVTGAARSNTPMGIILSNSNKMMFTEINATTGSVINAYSIMLDGEPFTTMFGDMASGCTDQEAGRDLAVNNLSITAVEGTSVLTSLPNPTSGVSQVVFTTAQTANTVLDVFDVSGRKVATIFSAEAQKDQEYRVDFNGTALPNGVYIYRLRTGNETIIDKFMIAR